MTMRAFLLSRERVSGTALAILRSRTRPGWVIEPRTRRVLAANKAGLAELGLRRDGANARLDRRMPALLRLQELAQHRWPEKRLRERLVFWAPRGSVSLSCDIFAPDGPAEGALVVVGGAQDDAAESDAATLRKIARRIRTAQGARKAPARAKKPPPAAEEDAGSLPDVLRKLAHELKTPLSAIAAAAEIMKDERLGPLANARYRGYAADIHESARHALSVIDRMLRARAESGSAAPAAGGIDAGAVARGAVSLMTPLAERAGVSLAGRIALRPLPVRADATALRQVLLNLLTNALKFTGPGGKVIVRARRTRAGTVEIAVGDTGRGMTPSEIAESRGPPRHGGPRRRKGGGLGLGLPLVRALAADMGAALDIASTPGKGTAVTLSFPRAPRSR